MGTQRRGQSAVVAVLLMAAAVIVVAGTFLYYFGGLADELRPEAPTAVLESSVNDTVVTVSHESGETIETTALELVLAADGTTRRIPFDSFTRRGDGDGELRTGERFAVGHSYVDTAVEVRVVHGPSQAVIYRDRTTVSETGTALESSPAETQSYSPETSQDGGGSLTVADQTYALSGNAWKEVPFDYTVTEHTVLVFEFRSTREGELHAIGLGTDNRGDHPLFKLYGTQSVSNTGSYRFNGTYDTYRAGDGWVRYEIPVGTAFQGDVETLVLVNDDDRGGTPESEFRFVKAAERS